MLYHDYELDTLADNKAEQGCRAKLKRAANNYLSVGNQKKTLSAYQTADSFGHLRNDMNLTIVCINQGMLFFNKTLAETFEVVQGIEPDVKGKVPSSVLVKMLANRLDKIVKSIKERNQYAMDSYKWQLESAKSRGLQLPPMPVMIESPEFRTIDQLKSYFTQKIGYSVEHSMRKEFNKNIFTKPELTDKDVSDAMNLVIMGQVTEE